jgi:hypothetical protein
MGHGFLSRYVGVHCEAPERVKARHAMSNVALLDKICIFIYQYLLLDIITIKR